MEAASVRPGAHAASAVAHEEHHHHGPPEANRSSRVDAQFLGMLLFIISEVMLFGAFFTAYFFIRAVAGAEWPPPGGELPVAVAAVNTAILISSSFTMHWALEGAKSENRPAMRAGLLSTFLLGATFLTIQINEYVNLAFGPGTDAQGTIFYGLTGLHGAHVFVGLLLLSFATTRAFRGHFTAKEHRGVEVPGIYWHFVDVMWVIVFSTIYIL
jgi:cytochrome c oxidase subunit III